MIFQVVIIGDKIIHEAEWISLNGSTGEVILGKQPLAPPALSGDLSTFMPWVDEVRQIKVKSLTNVLLIERDLTKFQLFRVSLHI